jgi:glycosyltransferase involved in cell wall biosynthesis
VKVAMLARASNRGLGIQTKAFHDRMGPDRTLVLDLGRERDPLDVHLDWYPDAWDACSPEQLTRDQVAGFLEGMDLLYTAETFYADEVIRTARDLGVKTVVHANFEFLLWLRHPEMPRPDLFLAPSPWRFAEWPEPKALVPFPVDRERFPFRQRAEARTFLHVGGWPTQADRNGTWSLLQALRHVHVPMRVVVTTQHELPTSLTDRRMIPPCGDLEVRVGDVADNRALYEEADVLVLPRRFGGLCLPMNEAASLGLAVLALDREPENEWLPPAGRVPCIEHSYFEGQPGRITVHAAKDEELAAKLQGLALDPESVALLSKAGDERAEAISWTAIEPLLRSTFERLCSG